MATITINIRDEVAAEFREQVKQKIGQHKGALGRAIEEALQSWLHDKEQEQIAQEMLELMEEGVGTLGKWKFKREDLYDRR